jgi:hypothetical protein
MTTRMIDRDRLIYTKESDNSVKLDIINIVVVLTQLLTYNKYY